MTGDGLARCECRNPFISSPHLCRVWTFDSRCVLTGQEATRVYGLTLAEHVGMLLTSRLQLIQPLQGFTSISGLIVHADRMAGRHVLDRSTAEAPELPMHKILKI